MARKYTPSCETTFLDSGLETYFLTLIRQKPYRFIKAIDCIGNRFIRVPSIEVMSSVIFEILMNKECDKEAALAANMYLNDIIYMYPPSDNSRRLFYQNSLTGQKRTSSGNLWSVFRHIVESSFIHHKLFRVGEEAESNVIPYPNCDILIDFYVRVLIESYDYLSSERVFHERSEKSLIMELFWPTESSNLSAAKANPRQFFEWINTIYSHSARICKIYAFKNLHKLLNLMVQCIVHVGYSMEEISINVPDSLICNSPCLLDIGKVIFNTCKEAFSSPENLRRFLHHLSSKALQFKLCEFKLHELLNSRQPSDRKSSPSTLLTIITNYMLPNKLNAGKKGRPKKQKALSKEDETNKKEKPAPLSNSKTSNEGESELHEFCRANKPADLYLSLSSTQAPDVNDKNNLGHTPLHVACLSKSYLCVKILIEECSAEDSKQKINFSAVDEDGRSSLHIAMKENAIDISKLILKKCDSKLLDLKDRYGRKPTHYASKEMKQILKDFRTDTDSDKSAAQELNFSDLDVPALQNFREYALFCHALHFLITLYSDIYNLYHIKKLMKSENSSLKVFQHEEKSCPHFTSCGENAICSEDMKCLKILPDIVYHFIKRTSESAKEKSLNLDVELLPAQMFACVLE